MLHFSRYNIRLVYVYRICVCYHKRVICTVYIVTQCNPSVGMRTLVSLRDVHLLQRVTALQRCIAYLHDGYQTRAPRVIYIYIFVFKI